MTSSSSYSPKADSYTIGDKRPLSLLNPNQFYKICPGNGRSDSYTASGSGDDDTTDDGRKFYSNYVGEHQPVCGDGSPFCFYFSKPSQKHSNRDKLLIEIMGGGACWDAETCAAQADYLYVSDDLDVALGKSCQEVQYGMQRDGTETNMLCSNKLGASASGESSSEGDNDNENEDDNESSSSSSSSSSSGHSIDFTQYNTIIIPYCTQDVHLGSNTMIYSNDDDDGGTRTVHHKGANNLKAVLSWVYSNFPALRHAAVTGCSAGGTAVPVVQQLLHKHYNHFGNRAIQVAAMADSPVYLTPTYFLENALDHWNPQPILNSIGVPYDNFRTSEEYPTMMWDYILKKGSNKNRWGFVSHTEDPISLTYYQYMSGNDDGNNGNGNDGDDDDGNNDGDGDDDDYQDDYNSNDDDNNRRRRLDNAEVEEQWYSELTASVSYIEKKHRNVKSYWMESEGHCSFGLYYALQEEGFDDFAASVFHEDALVLSARPAVRAFLSAFLMGTLVLAMLIVHRIRRQSSLQTTASEDESFADDLPRKKELSDAVWAARARLNARAHSSSNGNGNGNRSTSIDGRSRSFLRKLRSALVSIEDCPVTAGYTLCITVYFLCMLASVGFAHPINNPSLGPSAVGLSVFGINNPSLIVYQHQWFRLFTSNFLVSGVLTLMVAYVYLWRRIRKLEERMVHDFKSPWLFVTIIIVLATTINASYCLVPPRRGASTAAIPLLIGLQAFHLTFYWNSFVRPYLSIGAILFDTVVVVTLFPFNSWVMIGAGIVMGWITAKVARTMDVWLPGPMINILKQTGIHLEMNGSVNHAGSVTSAPAAFRTALSFPPPSSTAAAESEYNQFDGNVSNSYETMDDQRSTCPDHNRRSRGKFLKRAVCCGFFAVFVLLLVPLFVTLVATPSATYVQPFRTGCKSFYTVDIDDLSASSFLSGDDDGSGGGGENNDRARSLVAVDEELSESFFRWLAGGDDDEGGSYGCADFCVPHLLVPFVKAVLRKKDVPISRGQCSDQGYSTHVLDKTFTTLSYSLDVELYAASNEDDDNNNNGEK